MRTTRWILASAALLLMAAPEAFADHHPGGMDVELWTDRGNDAVYQPGEGMGLRVRSSEDGYLLVYEIDTEGYVRMLWPDHGSRGFVEGRQTLEVPSQRSNLELVVESATGQGYLVALVSSEPFRNLPWYLRPYDEQAEGTGYEGDPDDEDGVTAEGRIVGDPFVAMERIRRAVLDDPDDEGAFGTAYTSYYVNQRVRYPRYLCNDCHRPGYWAWWDGFDPYYASCSVFDFRVNWGWYWGPSYWFGNVPYYYYAVRSDCPPRYRMFSTHGSYSSWNGWRSWRDLMGGAIRRYKSPPPQGYIPPSKFRNGSRGDRVPPGFLVGRDVAPGRNGGGGLRSGLRFRTPDGDARFRQPGSRGEPSRGVARGGLEVVRGDRDERWRAGREVGGSREPARGGIFRERMRSEGQDREPIRELRGNERRDAGGFGQIRRRSDRDSRDERPIYRAPSVERGRSEPRWERPRVESPRPDRVERPRQESRPVERHQEPPRPQESRHEGRSEDHGDGHGGGRHGR
jgi:Domain of unknown function (DUF4384)